MFVRRFRKFFKPKKGNFRNTPKFVEKSKDDSDGATQGKKKKDKSSRGIQCHECLGYGHIQTECANFLKSKG